MSLAASPEGRQAERFLGVGPKKGSVSSVRERCWRAAVASGTSQKGLILSSLGAETDYLGRRRKVTTTENDPSLYWTKLNHK